MHLSTVGHDDHIKPSETYSVQKIDGPPQSSFQELLMRDLYYNEPNALKELSVM